MQMRLTLKNLSRAFYEPPGLLRFPASWFKQQAETRGLQLEKGDLFQIEISDCWLPELNGILISGRENISERLMQLNAFARKLQDMDPVSQAIYKQKVKNHRSEWQEADDVIAEFSRLADNISSYTIYEGIYDDEVLGEVCFDNGWLGSADGISEEMLNFISKEKMGEEYRKSIDGAYMQGGFAVPDRVEPTLSQTDEDFGSQRNMLDEKSDGTLRIILRTREEEQEKDICWTLPDPENSYRKLESVRYRRPWKIESGAYTVQECDCIIPQMNMMLKKECDFEKWNEFAECLAQLNESGQLLKYTALLSMKASESVDEALALAEKLDSYEYRSDICTSRGYAMGKLKEAGDVKDMVRAGLDLTKFGEIKLKQDSIYCCAYGLLREKTDQAMILGESHQIPEGHHGSMEMKLQ